MFSNQTLKRLIIPLIIEQLLVVTVGFADTIMVSSVGEAAVSAVSLVDGINILLINIFAALGTVGAVVAAQFIGQGSQDKAKYSAKQLILITGLLSLVIMIVVVSFNGALLHMIFGHVDEAVMKNAEIYFLFSALSYPFIALYNAGAALFRAIGNSKISMINSAIMNAINIVLNAIFIFGFKWGVFGAVFATLIARAVACCVILYVLGHS
ncbi:MAG: MATE family efflux transporter, partial [Coprobacillus sp.]